ncbi:MAG TPA: hypothetical protein VK983_03550 [Candidatus Limnocylindrales bacterium]|nr:hypothetical protein [Candidatus Limnocylindrales bacterium]
MIVQKWHSCVDRAVQAQTRVNSVRNPKKAHKLAAIAGEHGLDAEQFQAVCKRQLRRWPLLP